MGASREGDISDNSEEEEVNQRSEREEDNRGESQVGKVGVNTHKRYLCLQVRGKEVLRLHVHACVLIWAWRVSPHLSPFACVLECVCFCFAPGRASSESAVVRG